MTPRKQTVDLEDWDLFVLRHQKMPNVAVHFLSFLMFWLSPVLAILVNPWFVVGFFTSGLVGSFSHYIFKDGTVDAKEATSSTQVVYYSSAMALLFILGKYKDEITTSINKYDLYLQGKIGSTANPELFKKLG